jgi:exodeoxyribonuclease-3
MPVLPLVASMTVWPGCSAPERSASSMTARAMRSLTEPRGLKDSSLANTRTPGGAELRQPDQGRIAYRVEYVVVPRHAASIGPRRVAAPHQESTSDHAPKGLSLEDRQLERQFAQRPHAAPCAVAAETHNPTSSPAGDQARRRALPRFRARRLGYRSVFCGQKTYNGVALLSRVPFASECITAIPDFDDPQKRVLAATVGDIRIVDLYVVNGESVGSAKFEYKLRWLDARARMAARGTACASQLVVLGDFNIAPDDRDVPRPQALARERSCAPRPSARRCVRCWRWACTTASPVQRRGRSLQLVGLPAAAFQRNWGLRIDLVLAERRAQGRATARGASTPRRAAGSGRATIRRCGCRSTDAEANKARREAGLFVCGSLSRSQAVPDRAPHPVVRLLAHASAAEEVDDREQDHRADQRE